MKLTMLAAAGVAAGLIFGTGPAQASPAKRFDEKTQTCRILTFHNSGWASAGSRIFQESCKNCHYQGNDRNAPFLHAESKSMKGWNRVFFTRYPKCAQAGEWAKLSEEELRQLNDFLFRNAASTYNANSAADCG